MERSSGKAAIQILAASSATGGGPLRRAITGSGNRAAMRELALTDFGKGDRDAALAKMHEYAKDPQKGRTEARLSDTSLYALQKAERKSGGKNTAAFEAVAKKAAYQANYNPVKTNTQPLQYAHLTKRRWSSQTNSEAFRKYSTTVREAHKEFNDSVHFIEGVKDTKIQDKLKEIGGAEALLFSAPENRAVAAELSSRSKIVSDSLDRMRAARETVEKAKEERDTTTKFGSGATYSVPGKDGKEAYNPAFWRSRETGDPRVQKPTLGSGNYGPAKGWGPDLVRNTSARWKGGKPGARQQSITDMEKERIARKKKYDDEQERLQAAKGKKP